MKNSSNSKNEQQVEVEVPSQFVCPITQQIFHDPVVDLQGHNYERDAILEWLSLHGTCPLTRRQLEPSNLIPDAMLQTKIKVWQAQNGYDVTIINPEDRKIVAFFNVGEDPTEVESVSGNDEDDEYIADLLANHLHIQEQRSADAARRRRRRRWRGFRLFSY
jgi:hypothetical protein